MKRIFILLLSLFVLNPVWAQTSTAPLPADQAFPVKISIDTAHHLLVEWRVAPGYYLYRDKTILVFTPNNAVKVGQFAYPKGLQYFHGGTAYSTYSGKTKITIPLLTTQGVLEFKLNYQGCSKAGFCYAPIKKELTIDLTNVPLPADLTQQLSVASSQNVATQLLISHKWLFAILGFMGLGLLLSFTPCILPMLPILSGIIVDHHSRESITHKKAFLLSLFYVLGMALTYMVLGIVVALVGSSIQSIMEKSWVIVLFSGFFIALALSLLGVYELHVPASWQNQLMKWDRHLKHGRYPSAFIMGSLSSLMVSPCVTAPLVGVLAYIGQTGDVILGAIALFTLGIGMGIPLLVIGSAAKKLLPKSGPWMVSLQKLFGILMLAMAIWFLSRVIPIQATLLLWGCLAIGLAFVLASFQHVKGQADKLFKFAGIVFLVYGVMLMISVGFKNTDPLRPWAWKRTVVTAPLFVTVETIQQLDEQLALAKKQKQPVILDYYADWCTSCKLMEKTVFEDNQVRESLKNDRLLRVDLTENNQSNRALLKHFHVVAPPTALFFDRAGTLLTERLVGEVSAAQFLQYLSENNL